MVPPVAITSTLGALGLGTTVTGRAATGEAGADAAATSVAGLADVTGAAPRRAQAPNTTVISATAGQTNRLGRITSISSVSRGLQTRDALLGRFHRRL